MKRALLICVLTVISMVAVSAQSFMDMAVNTAKAAQAQGRKPCGAVVILNGAIRAAGMVTDNVTAEENAIAKSRRQTLENASIYTVNYPTAEALNAIRRSGAANVYYVNSPEDVIAAGIYSADDYDSSKIDSTLPEVEIIQIENPAATALLKP